MWTRIVLYTALGYVLDTLGAHWDTWGFWCIVGLFWACEQHTRLTLIDELNQELEAMRKRYKDSND